MSGAGRKETGSFEAQIAITCRSNPHYIAPTSPITARFQAGKLSLLSVGRRRCDDDACRKIEIVRAMFWSGQ
jgi:hypothetical protein